MGLKDLCHQPLLQASADTLFLLSVENIGGTERKTFLLKRKKISKFWSLLNSKHYHDQWVLESGTGTMGCSPQCLIDHTVNIPVMEGTSQEETD